MATVYSTIHGEQIQRYIARHKAVQLRLDREALKYGTRAEALLARHHRTGNARIEIEQGDIDRYVVLNDPDTLEVTTDGRMRFQQGDAMAIEYGHGLPQGGRAEGTWILHDTFGLPRGT